MMQVASYCRVSTDQDDQVNSFESQQRYFREYIQRHPDWTLYEVYADEGITGTSTKKRTEFNRMIKDAYEGKFRLILTKEVSRFSRNILDTITYTRELKAIGIGVQFMLDGINTLSPDAELYLSIMASIAQEESRKTSSRVVWGQTRQMERGIVFGHSLLGYDVKDGKISVNQEGAEIVRLIFQKYGVEQVSTSQIARFLAKEGYRTYRGSTNWSCNALVKILNNEKYVGDLVQKKSYTPDFLTHAKRRNTSEAALIRIENHHEPIISREVWALAQERLQKNNKHYAGQNGHSNRYIFSGKIKCGECGASFVGRFKYRKDGSKVRRWSCGTAANKGARACSIGKLVQDDDAMQMLKTALNNLPIDTGKIVSNVTLLALDAIQAGEMAATDQPEQLRYEMERVCKKKERLIDSYISQEISREEMQMMKQRYEEQLSILNTRLVRAEETKDTEMNTKLKTAIQQEVVSILLGQTENEVFCKTVLHSLTVFKDRHMELRFNYLPQAFRFTG